MRTSKEFIVGQSYRTNPLSFESGGITIVVKYRDGSSPRIYTNIKKKHPYKNIILNNDVTHRISEIYVKETGEILYSKY